MPLPLPFCPPLNANGTPVDIARSPYCIVNRPSVKLPVLAPHRLLQNRFGGVIPGLGAAAVAHQHVDLDVAGHAAPVGPLAERQALALLHELPPLARAADGRPGRLGHGSHWSPILRDSMPQMACAHL